MLRGRQREAFGPMPSRAEPAAPGGCLARLGDAGARRPSDHVTWGWSATGCRTVLPGTREVAGKPTPKRQILTEWIGAGNRRPNQAGFAVGTRVLLTKRVGELLENLEEAGRVERIPDGRYRTVRSRTR